MSSAETAMRRKTIPTCTTLRLNDELVGLEEEENISPTLFRPFRKKKIFYFSIEGILVMQSSYFEIRKNYIKLCVMSDPAIWQITKY